jgi:hypothetical protein
VEIQATNTVEHNASLLWRSLISGHIARKNRFDQLYNILTTSGFGLLALQVNSFGRMLVGNLPSGAQDAEMPQAGWHVGGLNSPAGKPAIPPELMS